MSTRPPPFPAPPGGPIPPPSKPPSAKELIELYKQKGLDQQAASEKAIEDLQKALTYAVQRFPKRAQAMEKSVGAVTSSIGSVTKRLDILEAKIDTKPSLAGVFGAGVAAGAVLQAVFTGVSQIFRAVTQVGRDAKQSPPDL